MRYPLFCAFFLLLIFANCNTNINIEEPSDVAEKVEYKFSAQYYIDTTHVQNQYYTLTVDNSIKEYKEEGTFLRNPSVIAKCKIVLKDDKYEEIEVYYKNEDLVKDVKVTTINEKLVGVYINGELSDSIYASMDTLLFEGPNPLFDMINAKRVLESSSNQTKTVLLIDWFNGELISELQTFSKNDQVISIAKKDTERAVALTLGEIPIEIQSYSQDSEKYFFAEEFEL